MSHLLFINPIGKHVIIQVIENEDHSLSEKITLEKTGNDFDIIPETLTECIKKYSPTEIWCICGPGPFTLMRIITLAINSISYVHTHIQLRSAHYFDLMHTDKDTCILTANRHEYLVRFPGKKDTFIEKNQLPEGKYTGYIDDKGVPGYTEFHPNIANIFECFSPRSVEKHISPLYIKPPHITQGSKGIIHPNL